MKKLIAKGTFGVKIEPKEQDRAGNGEMKISIVGQEHRYEFEYWFAA